MSLALNTLNLFNNKVNHATYQIASFRGILSGFGAYLLTRFLYGIVQSNIEVLEFSKRIGTSASEVSALDFAIQQTGQPIQTMRDVLADLTLQLAMVEKGNLLAARSFMILGLTAKDLKDLNPAEAFKLIASRIAAIKDPAQQAAAAVRIFGKEADKILPLLQMGGDGIAKAFQKANNIGLLVDDAKLEKLKAGRIAMENLRSSIDGFVLQLASGLAPVFGTIVQYIDKMTDGFDMQKIARLAEEVSLAIVAFFIRAFNVVRATLIDMRVAIIETFDLILGKLTVLFGKMADNKIFQAMFGDFRKEADEFQQFFFEFTGRNNATIIELKKLSKKIIEDPMNQLDGVRNFFNDLDKLFKKGKDDIIKENKALNEAFKKEQLFKGVKQDIDSAIYPLEAFQQKMRDLQVAMKDKAILPEEFGRAAVKNLNELESALGANQLRMASLERLGSAGGVSAINRATLEQANANQTPQARIERLLQQGNMNQKALVDYAKRTAEAAEDSNVLEFK